MNCFYHPQTAAVGICKYCQKGLCTECAVDLGHGIGCKHHQEEVRELYDIHFMGKQSAQNMDKVYKQSSAALVFMAIAGIVGGIALGRAGLVLVLIGVGCIFLAIVFSIFGNRVARQKNKR